MDLVASTLDKYLRHRFNGVSMENLGEVGTTAAAANGSAKSDTAGTNNLTEISDNHKVASEIEEEDDDLELPSTVHHVTVSNLSPCCVALSESSKFLAIGFHNSLIYLCKLSTEVSTESQQDPLRQTSNNMQDQSNDDLETPIINSNQTSKTHSLNIVENSKLLAHFGPVYSIEFVKNNDLMLSCSEDTTIRLWCLNTKCNLAIYRGHNYPIWSLAIGPSGECFASTSMDATARLWHFDKVTPLRIFCGHDGDVECVGFHPNSKYIATGSSDTTVRLWSISDAKMVRLMVGHKHSISSLSFMPDGRFLASADSGGSIKIWNLATNTTINEISIPAYRSISFNPERNFFSTCGRDNILRLWRTNNSKIVERKKIDFGDQFSMLLSSTLLDDRLLVICFRDQDR